MNVVFYARFGSQNQTKKSIEEQIKLCKDYEIEKCCKRENIKAGIAPNKKEKIENEG